MNSWQRANGTTASDVWCRTHESLPSLLPLPPQPAEQAAVAAFHTTSREGNHFATATSGDGERRIVTPALAARVPSTANCQCRSGCSGTHVSSPFSMDAPRG